MPGRVATFATCSTARSSTALANSSSEANTTPGTRMPSTYPTGTSQTDGSRRRGSDIQVHLDQPAATGVGLDPEPVVGDRLDEGAVGDRAVAGERHPAGGAGAGDPIDPDAGHRRLAHLPQPQHLVEPVDQQPAGVF